MNRRVKLQLIAMGTLLAGVAVGFQLRPHEPVWEGQRLSEWLNIFDSSNRFPVLWPPGRGIAALVDPAVPQPRP
jgi:hypothetical protein